MRVSRKRGAGAKASLAAQTGRGCCLQAEETARTERPALEQVMTMRRSTIPAITGALAGALILAFCASGVLANEAVPARLRAEARVSETDAKAIALARVPAGTISSSELEKEHGKLIWSFDIAKAGSKDITEIHVDAKSGKILSTRTETARHEAREAAAEAKEAPVK
ncbi:MAG: hypothetical protein NVS9B10_09960 [Nevskia sp.]